MSAPGAGGRRWSVERVPAEATHDLRRRVLRAGTPSTEVVWAGDDDATTVHLAVRDGADAPVGVATVLLAGARTDQGAQLRGMAVEPDRRGEGIGAALLHAAARAARDAGAGRLWANARDGALGFYVAAGLAVVGDGFVTEDTALPHHRVEVALPLAER